MPCHNAFLAVSLDDITLSSLAAAAEALATSTSELLGVDDVGFLPVDDTLLHMTFLFFGEHLRKLPANELVALHSAICDEVATAPSACSAPLAFRGFELFPPQKTNLVVAAFEPSPPLRQLRDAVLRRTRECGVSLPASLFSLLEGEGAWTPHVTLGKIRASSAQIGRVSSGRAALRALAPPLPVAPRGLTLLGEHPTRARCDWDAALAFPRLPQPVGEVSDLQSNAGICDAGVREVSATESRAAGECCSELGAQAASGIASLTPAEPQADDEQAEASRKLKEPGVRLQPGPMLDPLLASCEVTAVSSLRRRNHHLVELRLQPERESVPSCLQIVTTRGDVSAGQAAVVALPGAVLADGERVRRQKVAGEWSEGALVELGPGTPGARDEGLGSAAPDEMHDECSPRKDGSAEEERSGDGASDLEFRVLALSGPPAARGAARGDADAQSERLHFVRGDATLAHHGRGRKIIAHVCNDKGLWGKGFVMAVTGTWGARPGALYRRWHRAGREAGFSLGAVQLIELTPLLALANMIGQCGTKTGSRGPPVRYAAIGEALMSVGAHAAAVGASVHMPRIGTGLAGGDWQKIEDVLLPMIVRHGVDVYVYDYSG